MPTCPAGHPSGAHDYCDVCGTRMTSPGSNGATGGVPSGSSNGTVSRPSAVPAGAGEPCPDCSAPRTGRFCEGCGYDFAVGAGRSAGPVPASRPAPTPVPPDEPVTGPMRTESGPAASGTWTAVVVADRDYYERVLRQSGDGAGFTFPPYCPERRIPLNRPQIRIGRRSVSQGTVPEIDLGEPPEDPGASHTHAVLLTKPDGTWTLVDPGSTNGTTVNGSDEPIPVNTEVPMRDGDRIHIGVWTTITLQRG